MSTPKGFQRSGKGFRAYVRVGTEARFKRFPPDTKPSEIRDWRDATKVALRKNQPEKPEAGTLEAEIARYLLLVRSMPTIAQRTEHLWLWADALGRRTRRSSITPAHIRRVLNDWRVDDDLAAATCNKRRTALMHLFTELDGKDARNPVRAVPKFRVSDPLPRGRDPHVIDARLKQAPRCKARACARVMLWTGMRPIELERAKPEDISLRHRIAIIRTGKGGRTRAVPLSPQAVEAWKEFAAEGCWDEPDNTPRPTQKKGHLKRQRSHRIPAAAPMGAFLKKHTGMELRVYDLRHSYGTALAARHTRLDAIGTLMGHSTLDLTRRYTLAAVEPEALAATARLGRKQPTRRSA